MNNILFLSLLMTYIYIFFDYFDYYYFISHIHNSQCYNIYIIVISCAYNFYYGSHVIHNPSLQEFLYSYLTNRNRPLIADNNNKSDILLEIDKKVKRYCR